MEVLEELRATLAEDLEHQFTQASRRFEEHLALRDAQHDDLKRRWERLSRNRETALQIYSDRNLRKNEELQKELESLKSQARTPPEDNAKELLDDLQEQSPDSVIQKFSTESGEPASVSYATYAELAGRYGSLFHSTMNLLKAFSALRSQHRSDKDRVKDWYRLFEKGSFTIAVDGKRTTFRRVVDIAESCNSTEAPPIRTSPVNAGEHPPSGILDNSHHEPSTSLDQQPGEGMGAGHRNVSPQLPQSPPPVLVPTTNQSPRIKREPEDPGDGEALENLNSTPGSTLRVSDLSGGLEEVHQSSPTTPKVMASRSLKRKQRQNQTQNVPEVHSSRIFPDGSSRKPVAVKSEATSSSPLPNPIQQRDQNPLDTQDLDEVENSVQTPRKMNLYSVTNFTNPPFSILEDGDTPETAPQGPMVPPHTEPRANRAKHTSILQPKDRNRNMTRRSDEEGPGHDAKRRRGDRRGAEAIHIITEDGEKDLYAGAGRGRGGPTVTRGSGRLNDLLSGPSSPKAALTPRLAPKSACAKFFTGSTRPPRDPDGYGRLSLGTPSKTGPGKNAALAPPSGNGGFKMPRNPRVSANNARSGSEVTPDDEPYRARPVDRLSLDNFRINPERNEGVDYAFDNVVRKRDQRKCLPGCTRPDCCGPRFRALAKVGGLSTAPGKAASSETEDRELLENYLDSHRLENMGEDERREALIDAKAEALAARYGKHRYAHERHNSPPGFWRTDMPSTQELEKDREEAQRMEREKVESRYREAMRPGGMWKFADE